MAKILGKNEILSVYVDAPTDGYLPIACLTSNGIETTYNFNDGTVTKCDSSPAPTPTTQTATIPFEGVTDNKSGALSYKTLKALADESFENNDPLFFKIETTYNNGTTDVTETEYAKGFITDLSKTSDAEGEQTFSGNINVLTGKFSATDLQGV